VILLISMVGLYFHCITKTSLMIKCIKRPRRYLDILCSDFKVNRFNNSCTINQDDSRI